MSIPTEDFFQLSHLSWPVSQLAHLLFISYQLSIQLANLDLYRTDACFCLIEIPRVVDERMLS